MYLKRTKSTNGIKRFGITLKKKDIVLMYDVFTSSTGTLQSKFKTVKEAVDYAQTLGIDAQIFEVGNPFTPVKWVFNNPKRLTSV
jgi:hypothetical protein